jgi:hypothetical protein
MNNFDTTTDNLLTYKGKFQQKSNLPETYSKSIAFYSETCEILAVENEHTRPFFTLRKIATNEVIMLRCKDVFIMNPKKGQIFNFEIETFITDSKKYYTLITGVNSAASQFVETNK